MLLFKLLPGMPYYWNALLLRLVGFKEARYKHIRYGGYTFILKVKDTINYVFIL